MGYTHYWTINTPLPADKFAEYAKGVENLARIAKGEGLELTDEAYSTEVICFNGKGEDAHETFFIDPADMGFQFCKTARKPYDYLVVASLILAKQIFGKAITISSDGDWFTEWNEGKELWRMGVALRGIADFGATLPESSILARG